MNEIRVIHRREFLGHLVGAGAFVLGATPNATIINAINALSLKKMIKQRSKATPAATIIKGIGEIILLVLLYSIIH